MLPSQAPKHLAATATRFAQGVFARACDMLVPPACMLCETRTGDQGGLCGPCWSALPLIERPYCEQLGTPFGVDLGEGALCAEAIANPPPFARLRAVMVYGDAARKLVSGLKFSDRTDLAPWMARWMVRAGGELVEQADLMVPIPLHARRLASRRYNQSAELARAIARQTGLRFQPLALARARYTPPQIGLSTTARDRNVRGAFRVPQQYRSHIEGRRVLLIDDVYTSGATAKAATRALKRAGAAEVAVLAFAKVTGAKVGGGII